MEISSIKQGLISIAISFLALIGVVYTIFMFSNTNIKSILYIGIIIIIKFIIENIKNIIRN